MCDAPSFSRKILGVAARSFIAWLEVKIRHFYTIHDKLSYFVRLRSN